MAELKLAIHFGEQPVIDNRPDQGVSETAQGRAVRNIIGHAKAGKATERKAVVLLLLYLTVTQTVPQPHQFHAEQHHAVITRTARRRKAFAVSRFNQAAQGRPVHHGIYPVEEPGLHLAVLQMKVAKTQLGGFSSFMT